MLDPKFEQFRKLTKEEWLEMIRSELKVQSPEALAWEIEPGITADPFPHEDDMRDNSGLLSDEGLYTWEITGEFEVSDATNANHDVLAALEGGVQTIIIHNLPENGPADYQLLFKDIRVDFIRTIISVTNAKDYNKAISLISWFSETYRQPEAIQISLLFQEPQIFVSAFSHHDLPENIRPGYLFAIPESAEQHLFVEAASDFFTGLVTMLENKGVEPHEILARAGFEFRIGSLFFIEIARLKALRILWRNLTLALMGTAEDPFILVEFRNDTFRNKAEFNIIRASTMTLSAVLGRADAILVRPSGQTGNSEHDKRIARNIHHIFIQESHLNEYSDAADGSYYLESLTKTYASRCWEVIRKKLAGQIGESGIIHVS